MDQRASEIIEDIFQQRQRLGDNISELEQKVKAAATWQSYFFRKPWTMVGLAMAGGFLLSFVGSKPR